MSGPGLAVLTYHGFGPGRSVTTTDPAWFAETLAALRDAGFHGVDLHDWVSRGRPDEPRGFALAFDDGLASVGGVAANVAGLGIPATVFVVTGRVGLDNDWPGQPAFVPRERLLDWSELAELGRLGFCLGAHTETHARLDRLKPAEIERELSASRDAIEARTGRPCRLFAYPYGASTADARRVAARHFAGSFGTRLDYARPGQPPHDIARLDAYYLRSRRTLAALTSGRWAGPLRWLRAGRSARAGVSTILRRAGAA